MTKRPYVSTGIEELEAMAQQHRSDISLLKILLVELEHRTTKRSKDLLERVAGRIAELSKANPEWVHQAQERIGVLEAELKKALSEVVKLRSLSADLQAKLKSLEAYSRPEFQLYAEVGLHPNCPDFAVKSVRTAFRKELHPDMLHRASDDEKVASSRRFIRCEEIFEKISTLRSRSA